MLSRERAPSRQVLFLSLHWMYLPRSGTRPNKSLISQEAAPSSAVGGAKFGGGGHRLQPVAPSPGQSKLRATAAPLTPVPPPLCGTRGSPQQPGAHNLQPCPPPAHPTALCPTQPPRVPLPHPQASPKRGGSWGSFPRPHGTASAEQPGGGLSARALLTTANLRARRERLG